MANAPVDRDSNYMRERWGTTHLITDYRPQPLKKVLQEIMYDPAVNDKTNKQELFETSDDEFSYGIEPTYQIKRNQKVLRDWINKIELYLKFFNGNYYFQSI